MKRLLALVGLVGLVAIGLAAGFATSDVAAGDKLEGPNGEHKVVVCKYVGTPGVDERLQTGNNPITPDANSLPGFTGTFPWEFADAQGQSIAIRWAADSHDGDISECPAPRGPVEVTPTAPTFQDPTCDVGAAVNLPTVTGVTYTVKGAVAAGHKVTVEATADDGYVFPDGVTATWEHTFGDVPDTCGTPPTEVTATAPSFQDPTCDLGVAVNVPTVEGVAYTITGTIAAGQGVTVKAAAEEGYVLVGTSEWTHTFGNVPENCTAPPTDTTPTTPTEPTSPTTVPAAPLTPPTTKPAAPATKPKAKPTAKPAAKPAPPKQAVAGAVEQEKPTLAYTP